MKMWKISWSTFECTACINGQVFAAQISRCKRKKMGKRDVTIVTTKFEKCYVLSLATDIT